MESAIYSLWKINIEGLIQNKVILSKNFHIQPSELDKMPMWEYEIFLMNLNKIIKEENDSQKKEMDKYHVDDYMKKSNPNNINKNIPKTPSFKMPNSIKMGT